jgi:hypothetical protein
MLLRLLSLVLELTQRPDLVPEPLIDLPNRLVDFSLGGKPTQLRNRPLAIVPQTKKFSFVRSRRFILIFQMTRL